MILLFNFLLSNLWKKRVWNITYVPIILEINNCVFTKSHCYVFISHILFKKENKSILISESAYYD